MCRKCLPTHACVYMCASRYVKHVGPNARIPTSIHSPILQMFALLMIPKVKWNENERKKKRRKKREEEKKNEEEI